MLCHVRAHYMPRHDASRFAMMMPYGRDDAFFVAPPLPAMPSRYAFHDTPCRLPLYNIIMLR